jgi:hypothetical protein
VGPFGDDDQIAHTENEQSQGDRRQSIPRVA